MPNLSAPQPARPSATQPALRERQRRLSDVWDEHVGSEFVTHDVAASLATMTPDAYVDHVPVMTGGMGAARIAHEHIYRDRASIVVQLGLLDASALPVAGAGAARNELQPTLPSNRFLARARAAGR